MNRFKMSSGTNCPYCNSVTKKTGGRVVRQSTHLCFGYGEREYYCRNCNAVFHIRYSIPPKGTDKPPKPHPGLLRVDFINGVRGYADGVVLTAESPITIAGKPSLETMTPDSIGEEDEL